MITNLQLIEVEEKARTLFSEDVIELEEIDEDLTTLVSLIEQMQIIKKLVT